MGTDVRAKVMQWRKEARSLASHSIRDFLSVWTIDSSPTPMLFREVEQDWQKSLWSAMDSALETVAIGGRVPHPSCFWRTLPRGHDKTSSIGRRLLWLLAYSSKHLDMVCAASDREQASFITDAMKREYALNPWLPTVEFKQNKAVGRGGVLRVLTADAPSSYGLNSDIFVLDELTHWNKRDLWEAIVSGKPKRPASVLIIITNAGILDSWQDCIRGLIKGDSDWDLYESPPDTHLATWMTPESVAMVSKLLTPESVRRVIGNRWIKANEFSGIATDDEIKECVNRSADLELVEAVAEIKGIDYWVSVDYGPIRDRTTMTVLHGNSKGEVIVDAQRVYQGEPGKPVNLQKLEEEMDKIRSCFNVYGVVIDPYQLEWLAQNLENKVYKVVRFEPRGGRSNYELASTLRTLIVSRRLLWPKGMGALPVSKKGRSYVETFEDELRSVFITPTSYGFRIDHYDGDHDDRVIGVGMGAVCIQGEIPRTPGKVVTIPKAVKDNMSTSTNVGHGVWTKR